MTTPPDRLISETPIRVRYAETDAMGIAHHSAYIVWFEAGRSDWLRQYGGMSYADLEAMGYGLPVTRLEARFIAPCRYDELVTVLSWVESIRSRQITFGYRVVSRDGKTLATGLTVHLCTDRQGRVRTIPRELRTLVDDPS